MDTIAPNRMKWDFDRDQFCEAFEEVFPGDYLTQVLILCEQTTPMQNFIMFRCEEEYGILHIETGLYVRWYKHLGRANATNIPNGDLFLLTLVLLELRQETDGPLGIDTGFPEWEED